ncbi:2Fe-2S iron-sulfur cluster-binding protein [Sphingomonas sp. 37zxx]|uniref:2Fe-2S iron-sulfur cluster-binding protein n=1 Tax=Sphingomonas sp. 37zxx TaxID=1550073 RepID=UPI00053BFE0F|nr:2Fe-2S iron-sulfur cluster-binding protein [Sphingomonas sp. 37zxx]
MVRIVFVDAGGQRTEVEGQAGQSVMQAALENDIPGIEGQCGGQLSCATCHVIVDDAWYPRLEAPTHTETDMFDVTAAEPSATSRLCCQIVLDPALDGLILHVPDA